MATEYPGNAIPAPGYFKGNDTKDDELLYSTAGYTQKGVTLAPGKGVLLLGQPLAYNSTTKLWEPTLATQTGSTGNNVSRGYLRQTVDTGTDSSASAKKFQNNIVIKGAVKLSKVAAAVTAYSGSQTVANSITDLNGRQDTVLGFIEF